MIEPILSAAELAEALAYHRPKYLYALVTELTDLLVIALMLGVVVRPMFAASERLAARLAGTLAPLRTVPGVRVVPKVLDTLWRGPGWGAAILFAIGTYGTLVLLSLPAAIYFEWHERQFQLSAYSNAAYAWDWVKGFTSTTFVRAMLAFGMYGLARRVRHWWLPLGLFCGALMLFASALDPYRARMFFEQHPLEAGALRARVEQVLHQAKVEYADVLVEKTSRASRKANAYFAGQGPTRMVVLNDVLVERFTQEEIAAAVAHEAGHLSEEKWTNRVAGAVALPAFLGLLAWLFEVAARRRWWGITNRADIRTLPLATIAIYLLQSAAFPVTSYFSRERERDADAFAITLTQDPATFRSMLVKLCRVNKCDPLPPRWLVLRGITHPPLAERVQFAEAQLKEAKENQVSTGGPP